MTSQLFHFKVSKEITDFKDLCYTCRCMKDFKAGNYYDEFNLGCCECKEKLFEYTTIGVSIPESPITSKPKDAIFIISIYKDDIDQNNLISSFSIYKSMDDSDTTIKELILKNFKDDLFVDCNVEKSFNFKGIDKQSNYIFSFFETYTYLRNFKPIQREKKKNHIYKKK